MKNCLFILGWMGMLFHTSSFMVVPEGRGTRGYRSPLVMNKKCEQCSCGDSHSKHHVDHALPGPRSGSVAPNLQWYVIGESTEFLHGILRKIQVWDRHFVVWRAMNGSLYALDDACSHRGASLSMGSLSVKSNIVCPYHGYEFDHRGNLVHVPGIPLNHHTTNQVRVQPFAVTEKNGWVYLNTAECEECDHVTEDAIYQEPETLWPGFVPVYLHMDYECYPRILTENSLDVMHIPFTHSFGNIAFPAPTHEDPPKPQRFMVDDLDAHWKTTYMYRTGDKTIAKRIFASKMLKIENEFVLPHTTVARVIIDHQDADLTQHAKINTVVTSVLPLGNRRCRLYVKVWRNFWTNDLVRTLGDQCMYRMMQETMAQDKRIVEHIYPRHMNGKYNMKYDKLQNVYRTLYKKWVRNDTDVTERYLN